MIYAHKPGDSEPSYVLTGHESNVPLPLNGLIQVCALDVGADGTIISGSWDKYWLFKALLMGVLHEYGEIGNVYIFLKAMIELCGASWLLITMNTLQVVVLLRSNRSLCGQNDSILARRQTNLDIYQTH